MPQTKQCWLNVVSDFFKKHPEREFYVGEAGLTDVREAADAFWLMGFASQPMNVPGFRARTLRKVR